jgi:hypothetical protein
MPENAKQTEWKEKTNAIYQDQMKTVLNLATASLVLPIVLVKTFAEGGTPKDHLTRRAYLSWGFLFISIFACMVFFYASGKFLKVVTGGSANEHYTESQFENLRDGAADVSIATFLFGLICCFLFLKKLVAVKPRCPIRKTRDSRT